jgi:general secretion pathway protein C
MKYLLPVINISLLAVIVFLGVKALYGISSTKLDYTPLQKKTTKKLNFPKDRFVRPFSDYNIIVERNLFKSKTKNDKELTKIETLKPTGLDLKLWGTVTGNIEKSYAVIEETEGNKGRRTQNIYHLGDSLENAIIKKILREKVVLNVNGKHEILEIEEHRSSRRTRKKSKRPIHQKRVLSRTRIKNAVKNVNKVMAHARVRLHSEGLYITHIKPNSIFRQMGLINGDIITEVDGRRIEFVDDAYNFYRNMRTPSKLSLGLKRRGRLLTMNYYIR